MNKPKLMKIHICRSTVKLQRHKSSEIRVMAQIVQKIVVHSLVCPQMSKSQFGTIVSVLAPKIQGRQSIG
jgi:hypothetical protein